MNQQRNKPPTRDKPAPRRSNTRRQQPRRQQTRRQVANKRGVVTVCVLTCMTIVAVMLGWMVKDAITMRRETKLRFQMQQTERLLDVGILRAVRSLRRDKQYTGETWQTEMEWLDRSLPAVVEISVQDNAAVANESNDSTTAVTVTARLGTAASITSQSHTFSISEKS